MKKLTRTYAVQDVDAAHAFYLTTLADANVWKELTETIHPLFNSPLQQEMDKQGAAFVAAKDAAFMRWERYSARHMLQECKGARVHVGDHKYRAAGAAGWTHFSLAFWEDRSDLVPETSEAERLEARMKALRACYEAAGGDEKRLGKATHKYERNVMERLWRAIEALGEVN